MGQQNREALFIKSTKRTSIQNAACRNFTFDDIQGLRLDLSPKV